jgi:putative membrane protein
VPPSDAAGAARDRLAAERSRLANERTLLAYARTALATVVVGVTLLHVPGLEIRPLAGVWVYLTLGWALLALGAAISVLGAVRFRQISRRIDEVHAAPSE